MVFRDEFINLIQGFEGFKERPYICPGGYATIGYGHMIDSQERYGPITKREAQTLLEKDLQKNLKALERLIHVPLEVHQLEALLSFTFNLGAGAFQRSTLRQCINRKEQEKVPQELARWIYAGGKRLKGLTHRRYIEGLWYQGYLSEASTYIKR